MRLLEKKTGQVIYIKGFSGDIAYQEGHMFYKETSGDPSRLLHQAHKQQKYARKLANSELSDVFRVPKVTSVYCNGFSMEYVYGNNIIYTMKYRPQSLRYIIDSVMQLVDWEFSHSVKRPFKVKPFVSKLSPVCPTEYREYAIRKAKKLRGKWIHYGLNHGDLSMANMLFMGDHIYLLDFLKTFLRTPYQDIAKLQQEMDLHWAMLMSDYSHENKAIKDGYDYLSHRIQLWLNENYSKQRDIIHLFHFMCLCRLFPYAVNSPDVFKLVEYKCQELMEE